MRTSIAAISSPFLPVLCTLVLCLTACNGGNEQGSGHGSGDGSGHGNGHGNGHRTAPPAEGHSTATMNDNKHVMVDGAARFSQTKKELRVALSSSKLTPAQAMTMTDVESKMRMVPSREPYLEITFTIKDPQKPLSPTNVGGWRIGFWRFGKGPMTLNKLGAQGIGKLSGKLTPGGTIRLQITGEDTWDMGNDKRVYRWSLDHRVPVLGKPSPLSSSPKPPAGNR